MSKQRFLCAVWVCIGLGSAAASSLGQPATFTPLGDLPGRSFMSFGERVSADGTAVVGSSDSIDGVVGFRWTLATGIQRVPMPPGTGNFAQDTQGVSSGGAIIVGGAWGTVPFQWTAATGSVALPNPNNNAGALDITSDGAAIAGFMAVSSFPLEVVSWDASGFHRSGVAMQLNTRVSVSDTGHLISATRNISGGTEGVLWSTATGVRGLGSIPGAGPSSYLRDISADGSVAVGGAGDSSFGPGSFLPDGPAARWTDAGGWQVLTNPFGDSYGGIAEATSSNGSMVVGEMNSPSGLRAFMWDAAHGVRLLDDLLTSNGASLGGYDLRYAFSVSDDGLTITGSSINPAGFTEGWVATLPSSAVPEPASVGLALASAGMLLRRTRNRSKR